MEVEKKHLDTKSEFDIHQWMILNFPFLGVLLLFSFTV